MKANAKLVRDFRIDVDDGRDHAFCLDLEPPDGTNMGPSALELAVMGLAGCYATIYQLTARKMRLELDDLEVHMEAAKSEKTGTISEVSAIVTVKSSSRFDRVRRCHELTLKNCPVGILFDKAGVKMSFDLQNR